VIRQLKSVADGAYYDTVVIDAGGVGMAAALYAAIDSDKVLLVERTQGVGGNTALSAATTWFPKTLHAEPNGDSTAKATRFLDQVVDNRSRAEMRDALIGRLLFSLLRRDADILSETSVVEILRRNDGVAGFVLGSKGSRRKIEARLGVILASGGFNRHKRRRAELLPQPTPQYSPAAPGHTGKAQGLALALGNSLCLSGRSPCGSQHRPIANE
jgi:succinate dehydrogenase/fumarate reductase flavoprotein subunit